LGWQINEAKHDWNKLVETVTNHVHMLNFRYRNGLRSKNVHYIRALADLVDHHTISYEEGGKVKTITAEHIAISVGGRPHVPSDIPGALDYAITSDDIFTLDHPPGKTLCVGGSYISLECAGFLTGLGYDVSVAVRSILLRGFDRQCAEKIGTFMEESGTTFLYDTVVRSIDKTHKGRLQVTLYHPNEDKETIELYDTVLFATGRTPDLKGLKLSKLGVKVNEKTGKIIVNNEVTSIPNIYAIGDVCDGTPELTPVAIKAGELLAKRLFSRNQKDRSKFMDYQMIPTTVYTPTEYGSIGFSEEDAKEKYGEENIEVYLSEFTTLEISAVHRLRKKRKLPTEINQEIQQEEEENNTNDGVERNDEESEEDVMSPNCLAKLICLKTENERVIGFHFVGPNAGEITQVR
jgi:thioredoxin reductase (NADPH)